MVTVLGGAISSASAITVSGSSFNSVPMVLIFGLSLYAGTRMLNEEFLMGYRPLLAAGASFDEALAVARS